MGELPTSLKDILKGIDIREDTDIAFVVAASINMYLETMRRIHGRMLLGPQDAVNLFYMIDMLLSPTPAPSPSEPKSVRTRELTEEESQQLLKAIEPAVISQARRA